MHPKSWTILANTLIGGLIAVLFAAGCQKHVEPPLPPKTSATTTDPTTPFETATFGSGCFWCTEAVFESLKGVKSVTSGYSGGTVKNPTYKQVCSETTGHAEVSQVVFDPAVVAYKDLLEVFWKTHDPTTLNRQEGDWGTQYRSVVFYHNDRQKALAETAKKALIEAAVFPAPIVTAIEPFTEFFPADDSHQDFYANNPEHGYCRKIILPKLEKLHSVFQDKVR